MSETPPEEPTSAAEWESSAEPTAESESDYEPSPGSDADYNTPAPRSSGLSSVTSLVALVIAVLAIAAAVLGWFFPHKEATTTPTYSDQQTKDAKKKICEVFRIVDHEVVRNSRLKNPPDGGPIGALSVATAARLAFYSGGAFLRDEVNQNPATPPDLAKSVNDMSTNLQELAIGYLAGAAEFAQDELRQSLDEKIKKTIELCK